MGEVTIKLRHNPKTGKKVLTVEYESEADLLPHEHERDHRALVEALIGKKLDDDVGEIVIERAGAGKQSEESEETGDSTAARPKTAQREGE